MKKNICFAICCILFVFSPSAFAQIRVLLQQQEIERLKREQDAAEKRLKNLRNLRAENVTTARREKLPLGIPTKRTEEQNRRLLPDEEDVAKYETFLKQPKTGLIKLFSDLGCEEHFDVVKADESCLNWIPNSAFYSFREKEYSSEALSDLRLKENFFITDGLLSQGIMVALGDVKTEDVFLSNRGLKYLTDYEPNPHGEEALKQSARITKGVNTGEFLYKKFLPVKENTTYAMRAIAYRGKLWNVYRGAKFNVLEGDKRVDLIVVFRVVRKSDDGSVTLLWKELQRKESPKVIFPRSDKNDERKFVSKLTK